MLHDSNLPRRTFLEAAAGVGALACSGAANADVVLDSPSISTEMRPNMTGAYGPWLADVVLGSKPGALSFRSGKFASVVEWRTAAHKRALECIAPVDLGGVPEVRVDARRELDGLAIEELSWQLPCGPRTVSYTHLRAH